MRVWVTKHAFTQGIIEVEVELPDPMVICRGRDDSGTRGQMDNVSDIYLYKPNWHVSLEEAMARVEVMLTRKRISLEKQLKAMDKLRLKALAVTCPLANKPQT